MTGYLRFFDYDKALNYYCELIAKMNQRTNRNNHERIIAKPILVLTIIKLIEDGEKINQFTYEEIEPIYKGLFGEYFIKAHQLNLTCLQYPYYFLKSDNFWHLAWTNSELKTESPNRAWLERNTQYAFIDQELWILLSHPFYRKKLKEYIINEKILKVYNDEKNKGILKSLLQLLMVI